GHICGPAPNAGWRCPEIARLVPAVRFLVRPGTARRTVRVLDVGQAPLDLRLRICLPVRPGAGHLGAGERLRDTVGAAGVVCVVLPAALTGPQTVQTAELAGAEAVRR